LPIGRHESSSSFGLGQNSARITNETTRTMAAVTSARVSDIGMSAFWEIPCAKTVITARW
jgi:hypothetical protein